MDRQILASLFNNSALLLAMCLVYDSLALNRKTGQSLSSQAVSGFILGAIGVAVMVNPWHWHPGIIFDTRSILLCISGLFFGVVPTCIAMVLTCLYRLHLGGNGVLMGVFGIITSGALGIIWRQWGKKDPAQLSFREIYGFGVVVHLVLLSSMLFLPGPIVREALLYVGIPIMVIYPAATAILGMLMVSRHRHTQSEDALGKSEERFTYAMDATNDGLWDWDIVSDSGYFSPGYYRMLGYEPGEFPTSSESWLKLLHPEDRDRAFQANIDCVENRCESFEVEFRMQDKGGSWRWILGRGKAVSRDSDGKALRLIGTHVDITERKTAEVELQESEKRYREVFDNSFDGIFLLEVTEDQKLRILDVNATEERLIGISAAKIRGKYLEEFLPPEMAVSLTANYRRCIIAGTSQSYEESIEFKSGSSDFYTTLIPIANEMGRIYRIVGISHDITKRKQDEERVRESELMYRQLFELESDAIFLINAVTGEIIEANQTAETLYGYEREELLAMKNFQLSAEPQETRQATADKLNLVPIRIHRKKDGTVFPVEITASHFTWKGKAVHLAAIRDISERKRAEDERKELMAQLSQSQKMEAVGQLAGGVAHDFNNILTVIFGYAHILLTKMEPSSPLRHPMEQILLSATRAAELTQGLLAFSRKQVLTTTHLDLGEVIRETEKMLNRLVREDIELRVTVADRGPTVKADRGQIGQVLINLVTNAVDAMPSGGILTITVAVFEMDDLFVKTHGFGQPGSYAEITVRDTGCGMDTGTAKKVFEPFFTTKDVGKGTGLGLSIVYGIIKQHAGFIAVESEINFGTAFRIFLPLASSEAVAGAELKVQTILPQSGTETILLAEDDETVRAMNAMAFEGAGYRVLQAHDGQDAITKFIEHKEAVDLLVFDVIMPKKDGKRAYEEICAIRPDIKVLFISGYTKDIVLTKGVLEDEIFFIAKPFRPQELLVLIRDILDRQA
ncbi:MAG: PAS domain S-box protein [Deltaproteobacteria bacterium]|nr:PAS domain S-box protein [Deltaproteobacteria bacterium]TLN03261.1 MAG: PAS domain S-box protein [bacterium]